MGKILKINQKIKSFSKKITIDGDKSLSIRWALLSSQAKGISRSYNLLRSEDVLSTLKCLKTLGIKVKLRKNYCEIKSKGLNKFNYRKNITLNAGNSGTLGRLIMGLLIHSNKKIKIIGDKSLSKRDFLRVTEPLEKMGANFKTSKGKLPIKIQGTNIPKPIKYIENKGSAQCKSSIMLAALNTKGVTSIKARKSRNHTELLYKYLNIPIKIKKERNFDFIKVHGVTEIKTLNYKIPSDISSCAFFITLTILSKKSKILIKNVNLNPTRTGFLKIIKLMGIKTTVKNKRNYKGEIIGDLQIKSHNTIKPINCPTTLNSASIDEFLLIFLIAAKAKGVSYFKNLSELNEKESPRLKWGSKILNKIGIKTKTTKHSIKIFGNPELKVTKEIEIKNFLKDHRVFMASVLASITFGGPMWYIHDKDSINTSFPSFLKKISEFGVKIN